MACPSLAIHTYFRNLKDPRRAPRHLLVDIVGIAICAVIAGANDWQQIETFAHDRRAWLQRFFKLPNGIPSHDTFERVFDRIKPQAFAASFGQWMQALAEGVGIKQIAIDGKTLRGSGAPTRGLGPLHLVSAWATANQLSLGQVAVDGKSNEITAIPELLDVLDLRGALWPWIETRRFALVEALRPGLMLFGEWCFAVHSVPYTRLPDWFLGFDIYDRAADRYWSSDRRDRWLDDLGLPSVPRVAQGRLSMEQLIALIGTSRLSDGPMEGVYLRRDRGAWLEERAKLVRAEFVEGIGKHWSEESLEKNALASKSFAARK